MQLEACKACCAPGAGLGYPARWRRSLRPLTESSGMQEQPANPLHGLTLEAILTDLVTHLGWQELGRQIPVRCFLHEPSIKSSLKFLRRTPWARARVEALYLTQR